MNNFTKMSIDCIVKEDSVDSDGFNSALAEIQDELGQNTGDFAGIWFSGKDDLWAKSSIEERRVIILQYIEDEKKHLA